MKKPLTLLERIILAEAGLDLLGTDARIMPPPIFVDEKGQPAAPGGRADRKLSPSRSDKWLGTYFDYAGFAEARCPAPYLKDDRYIK